MELSGVEGSSDDGLFTGWDGELQGEGRQYLGEEGEGGGETEVVAEREEMVPRRGHCLASGGMSLKQAIWTTQSQIKQTRASETVGE